MKSCPTCERVYTDDTLNFCLDDGQWLVANGVPDEPRTAILSGDRTPPEAATRQQFTLTEDAQAAPSVPAGSTDSNKPGSKARILAAAAGIVLVMAGVGAWIVASYGIGRSPRVLSFDSAKFTRMTNSGQTVGGALSPDGRYIAQVVDDGSQQSLWLKQTAAASEHQVLPPAQVIYSGVAFTPDGNHLYYSVYENGNSGTLYQIPVLGGQPRKLLTNIHSAPAFSPDGSRMAFFRVHPSNGGEALMLANSDGTNERQVALRSGDEEFFSGLFATVSWSPDGRSIATPIRNLPENYLTVATVSVETGELRPLTDHKWFRLQQVAWLPDGESVLTAAAQTSTASPQIWQITRSSGEVRQVTNDLNGFLAVGLTKDGNTIATVRGERAANIWTAPTNDPARLTQVTSGTAFSREMDWTPDGRIIYASTAGGNWDIFLTDGPGAEAKRLTTHELADQYPLVTPDGRAVVFMSDRTGPPQIWRMDIDGSNQTQLTHGDYHLRPRLTRDGRTIIFESSAGESWALWKVPLEGGQPVPLNDLFASYPAISPDGKLIAVNYSASRNTPAKLAVFSSETGALVKEFDVTFSDRDNNVLDWTPDGQAIVYRLTKKNASNLWAQALAGGAPKQITNFTSDRIFWFRYSPDGKQIALSRGTLTRDIVLITNFK